MYHVELHGEGDVEYGSPSAGVAAARTLLTDTASKNITSLACGVEPSSDGSLVVVYSVFIGLAVLAVILRIVARVLTEAYFWWDDFANLFGFVSVDCLGMVDAC